MTNKKKVLLNVLIIMIIGILFVAYYINYNKRIQADKLYPSNYQFVSCFINKRLFHKGSDSIKIENSEVYKILEKYQVKRARKRSDTSGATHILFELRVSDRPEKWPKLQVFNNGIIWADKDDDRDTITYMVQGEQKDALYEELLEMINESIE